MDLNGLRKEIDDIDSAIVNLFEKRMDVTRNIAEFKIANGKKVFDRTRELEKISLVQSQTHTDFNRQGISELFAQIMSMSRRLQYQLMTEKGILGRLPFIPVEHLESARTRVVFQGAEGSYSQAAMEQYFGNSVDSFHVDTFRDAMESLEEGRCDFAILPIENSTSGSINEVYDLLVEYEHYIVGQQIIKIEQCLMALPGTRVEDIRTVYSHPQSLLQSAKYLSQHSWQQISMQNNAFAAKKVSDDKDRTQAAIAGEYAASVYGLEVLAKGINQEKNNSTRFIIVSNQKIFQKDAGHISICLELPHESGALYHILSHFIFNNLSLTKIESRPIEGKNWEYRFFIDFEGNLADSAVVSALRGLREEARNVKILGNY